MPIGVSAIFSIIETPYGEQGTQSTGLIDDWKWDEGEAPPLASPLIPHLYHTWDKMKWISSKIVSPKLSFQGVDPTVGKSKVYTMPYVNNKPTYITDHHVISIRRLVEQLWSPKFHAHIHLQLEGEIYVKPLHAVTHGAFRAAQYYEYFGFMVGIPGHNTPYVFSVGGFYNDSGGHGHYWNAGASGKNTWKAKIHFDHGGSIPEAIGNYKIEKIEYSYTLHKYYRKVFSQDGDNIWSMDYNAYIRRLHLPIYDSFDGQWLIGFSIDSGDYISTDGNTVPNGRGGRAPKYALVRTQASDWVGGYPVYVYRPLNIMWSACTLPVCEMADSPWFGGGGSTHDPTSVYTIALDHAKMLELSDNRFIQLSVYMPDTGTSVGIENSLEYFEKQVQAPWTEGEEFEITVEEADEIDKPDVTEAGTDSKFVTSLIGTRLEPMFRVTYRDMNNNLYTQLVTETELYGVDSLAPDNGSFPDPPDLSSCEILFP